MSRADAGTARAFVDMLAALWLPSRIPAPVAERVRTLMRANVVRHRLAPDFASDSATWSSKTGTLLNLRHEVGVVEHEDGAVLAVAAFSQSAVPAGRGSHPGSRRTDPARRPALPLIGPSSHMIPQVTENGPHALTRYQRVVITVK